MPQVADALWSGSWISYLILVVGVAGRMRFIGHIVAWMSEPKCNEKIRNIWYQHWSNVDADLGKLVKKEVEAALKQ